MQWASFSLSHHCPDTTLSVVSLCNNEIESPHLLAIGSDLGTVDIVDLENRTSIAAFNNLHDTQVLDVEFYSRDHILSYDKYTLIHLDTETQNRTVLYDQQDAVQCLTLSTYTSKLGSSNYNYKVSPIIASTKDRILNFDLYTPNPAILMENQEGIHELCLLPDEYTLIALKHNCMVATDVRNPQSFYPLSIDLKFERLSCNNHYLAAITKDSQLYSFELPLMPTVYKNLMPIENPFISRPAFCDDYIVVGNEMGMIFVIDPKTEQMDMIQCPIETPIVSVAASSSEISISLEDDIYVFSEFPFEDNLLHPIDSSDEEFMFDENGSIIPRPNENAEELVENDEDDKIDWLKQSADIVLEDGECSYERYGYCEQQIFVCLTCSRDQDRPIGVCEQCSTICHDGHDVRPIGTRRRFRCDCGNGRCPQFCKAMVDPKVTENTFNRYNHNFHLRWCICDGLDVPPMVQCVCCDDWFHHECIGFFSEMRCLVLDETPCLADWIFVCNDCLEHRLRYLLEFPDADPPDDIRDFVLELQIGSEIKPFTERPNYNKNKTAQEEKTTDSIEKEKGSNLNEEGSNSNNNENNSDKNDSENKSKETLEQFKERLMRDGLGFTILGGKWINKNVFFNFKGEPEFDDEFSKIDPTEEDKNLPVSLRQKEFSSFMRKAYEDIFKLVSTEGRTVIQKSDADAILGKNASQLLMQRRREHDHDDDNNND